MRKNKKQERTEERGQSMVELAVGLPFVLLVIIALVEMGLVFATYISMINATREGAIFASRYPELADINGAHDNDTVSPGTTTIMQEYKDRVYNEVFVVTTEQLRANQLVNYDPATDIKLDRPFTDGTSNPGDPITVTLHYSISTFTSNISLPFFGRFGLPNRYHLQYSFGVPIR